MTTPKKIAQLLMAKMFPHWHPCFWTVKYGGILILWAKTLPGNFKILIMLLLKYSKSLVISNGADLEKWAPPLIRQAPRRKIARKKSAKPPVQRKENRRRLEVVFLLCPQAMPTFPSGPLVIPGNHSCFLIFTLFALLPIALNVELLWLFLPHYLPLHLYI